MSTHPSRFSKIFGSGPMGLVISLALLYGSYILHTRFNLPEISQHQSILNTVFYISVVLTFLIVLWSVVSLPATDRGNRLCTAGAFRYVSHPLYAAFLSVFNFGLAFYLNGYIFIVWAILQHAIWHYLIRYEEHLMEDLFGDEYREYRNRTGRFVPKLW